MVRSGLAGMIALREPHVALTAFGWSAVVWTLAASTNVLVFRSLGLNLNLGAALLQLLLHMTPVPAHTPARIGEHQGLTVVGLAPYGVDASSRIAYAAALYAVVYIPQVLMGAAALAMTVSATRRGVPRDLGDRAGI